MTSPSPPISSQFLVKCADAIAASDRGPWFLRTRPGHLCPATDPLGTGGRGEDTRDHEQERGGLRYRGRHEALTGPVLREHVRPCDLVAGRGDSFHACREGAGHVDRLELI